MNNLHVLGLDISEILFRPHPSENPLHYSNITDMFSTPVRISSKLSLAHDLSECDIVVGCSSMAMVLAVFAGRRTISCIPNDVVSFTLPFRQIEHFSDLYIHRTDA